MNSSAKGDKFCLDIKNLAIEKGLDVLKVRASGHMGNRGAIPADLVIQDWRIEAKRYKGGIGSKAIEDILKGGQGVHAVASKSDRGMALIHMELGDFLDLLKGTEKVAKSTTIG